MGACFDSVVVNTNDKNVAKEKFETIQDNDRYENGHSYSGTIGMANGCKFTDKEFSTYNEADDWLAENAQKWGPALGVRVKNEKHDCWVFGAWCSS